MSPHRTPLTLLLLLTTFLFHTSAYPSCSSLTAKSPLSSIPPDNLFKGCSIEAHDQFQRQYSLLDPLERPYSFNFHSNHTKNFHISLTPSSNTHLDIEITSPDEKSRHSIPFPASSLILISVSQGHLTVSVGDSPPIFSYNLTYSFPYTFSVQKPSPSQNSLTANHHMFRLLEQCPEGYVLLEGTCGKVCPAKQFNSKGVCTRCPEKCYTGRCISETTCNPCNSSEVYHEQSNTCLEKCPTSYFEDYNNKICIRCADGCASCSFPYGTCSATYFKSDMLINLIVSLVLLALITLCACFCNKETPDPSKTTQEQQPSQTDSQNPENLAKGKSDHIKKVIGVDPKAPYLVLPEGFDSEDHDHSGNGEFPDRRKKKRLTEYAESRFLSVSLSKRGFMIDDADEEKAISHGSATLKGRGPGSFSSLTSKTNSPLFPTKRRSSKNLLPSSLRPKGKSQINVDETMTPKQNSYGDVASPFSVLVAKKETSLGLMAVKKDPTLYLDSQEEEQETVKLDIQFKMAPLELPEAEEIEEVDEEERKEKEGYQNDSSLNMSKDGEVAVDMYACTICGMNKRDCLNRPCGHFVGCYACMEQFKESYGVCPRCKKLLVSIEKMEKK